MSRFSSILAAVFLLISGLVAGEEKVALCTTFPVYQIARNVAKGRPLAVRLMLPAGLGCPHDYALTPRDMQTLAAADVLIANGLGLEEFLGAPLRSANPKLAVIDSSRDVADTLQYTGEEEAHADAHPEQEEETHGEHHEAGHAHVHAGVNPHLFASPRRMAKMAKTIAEGLAAFDPDGAAVYRENARAYAERLDRLADEFAAAGKTLKNNRIVTQHGVFDYLARDMGLEIVGVVQAHAGQEPSAAEMIALVKTMREKKAGAVFTEPQYPDRIGQTLAKEAGIPAATLDPVASGPDDAPLDYYETTMRKNLETLKSVLGTK